MTKTYRPLFHVLSGILLLAGCAPRPLPPSLLEEGVSWELAELRSRILREVRYHFHLSIPPSREEPIEGALELTFLRDDPMDHPLILDFLKAGERVHALRVNGRPVPWEATADHLVVEASSLVQGGENRVELEFTAGDEALNRDREFLYALFVPERARYSLPVFDQPNLKARFTLTLEIPEGWTAMANGSLEEEERAREGRLRLRFRESEPLPAYLFTFAAGRFERVEGERGGRTLELLHRETDPDRIARNLEAVFDLHHTALTWLEEYTGIPYPFQKFGMVAVPDFQYGGMEHPGAVFYRASSLFLEEPATQAQRLGRASLIAHETAHMWFGDLVTMSWFDDVWTKEVFANFMAAKIVHPSFPELDHELRFLLAHHPAAYAVDRTGGANPIRQPLANLREAGSLYGAIIYQKAPVVMRQLELLVGEEALRDGIREYLERFAFGNASWPDLIEILDRRSPHDLAEWSRVWVEETGRPTVEACLAVEDGRIASLTLRQSDPGGGGRLWPQPLHLALGHGDTVRLIALHLREEAREVPEARGLPLPDFVLPDGRGTGYALFRLDARSRGHLLRHLPELRDPVARGAAWLALWDGVLEGEVPPEEYLELALRSLEAEGEEQLLQRILSTTGTLFWTLLPSGGREARVPELEEALWRGVEEARTSSRRSTLFRGYRSVALTPQGVRRLEALWRGELEVGGLTLGEEDRIALAGELALREVAGWEEILAAQGAQIRNPDRRARYDFVLPFLHADPRVREEAFLRLEDPSFREKEPWVLEGLAWLHHPLRGSRSEALILPALELVEEIQRTGDIFFPGRWLDALLGRHNSRGAAQEVREFLSLRPDYPFRLRLKILQSADPLFRAVRILQGPAAGEER